VDLIIRKAKIEKQDDLVDIGISDGRIAVISKNIEAKAGQEIDAKGMLASPPFIDSHHHLDMAFITDVVNKSGTLEEAIALTTERKKHYTAQDLVERAGRAIRLAVTNGTLWIRSHVDVDPVAGLRLLQGVLEARQRFADMLSIQVVAFPQLGLARKPEAQRLLRQAMLAGADVVGGMPHGEATPEDAARHIEMAFDIARAFDADVDMHVDETDDPQSHTLELLAEATIRHGYQGRVTASHCCALSAYDEQYARQVIEKVKAAQISIITNPPINLMLQGRHDKGPVRRGITRVKELLDAGVNVACGQDDIDNPFYPFGQMDMLEVALFTAHAAHLGMPHEIQMAFDMPRYNAARALRLPEYGLKVGAPANIVIIDAASAHDALRLQPDRRYVIKEGQIIAETVTTTKLKGKPVRR